MFHFIKLREKLIHPMLVIGLVIVALIPVSSWASAQNGAAPLWTVRSLNTSEFGVHDPKGLAFSSADNMFLLLDEKGLASFVTMDEEPAGTQVFSGVQDRPLNMAFDDRTRSLFVLDFGKSQLAEIEVAGKSLKEVSAPSAHFAMNDLSLTDPQGMTFDPGTGRLFILDAAKSQIVSVAPHPTLGFDVNEALRAGNVQRISLKKLRNAALRGIAYNPANGHLYVSDPGLNKLYELSPNGDLVSSFGLASLGIRNPSAMTFAPSVDNTDDPGIYDLFLLDESPREKNQSASASGRIVELSLQSPAALPPGITLVPATLVQIIDTSNASWNPSSPDPSGVEYWPLTNRLLVVDSEVEEMPAYWQGKNVYQSTTSGNLGATCSTTSFTMEPTGVAINPNNNHIFITTDFNDRVFEVSLGADGNYCTADDTVTTTNVSSLYKVTDAEDVAYGNNTLFVAGGAAAEVYRIPLGADGVLGGGDDGAMTHFDTASLGFADLEGIGYNADAGTLFILSTKATDRYLGETTPTGTLLRAYDLSLMGTLGNIRSDVTYAPGSQNPGVKNIYIASRGVDNDTNRNENDGRIWEIALSTPPTPTVTRTPTQTRTPTPSPTPGPPGMATLISPAGTIGDTTPAYTWNVVPAATWYYLWVNKGDGTTAFQPIWYSAAGVCGASTCSVTPTGVTLPADDYTWWIQTWNPAGYGPWSDGRSFSLALPPAATLVSPSGAISDTSPTYTWNKAPTATWYYLWVNKADGTAFQPIWYEAFAICGASTCSVTPNVNLGSGTHTWWIQTWNDVGYGPWSSGTSFSLP